MGVPATPSAADGGPVRGTGLLQAPPWTGTEQSPTLEVPAVSVEWANHTRQGLGSLDTVYAVYSSPFWSIVPTTKSLVVLPACPFDVATCDHVCAPSQEMFTSVPLLLVPMNS